MKTARRILGSLVAVGLLFWLPVSSFAATVVLEGGRYLDSGGVMKPFAAIVLAGDRIKAIIPTGEAYTPPADAARVDARGRYVIPGLIDGHVHLVHILFGLKISAEELFPLFLVHGVTSVRDTGDELVGHLVVKQVGLGVHEDPPRPTPLQGKVEPVGDEVDAAGPVAVGLDGLEEGVG